MSHLVILPGLDGTQALSGDFRAELAFRGITNEVIEYSAEDGSCYDDLEEFVRARLPDRRQFVLLAESFSGPVGLRIATKAPPNLLALVLSSTFACKPIRAGNILAAVIALSPMRLPVRLLSPLLLGTWSTSALRRRIDRTLREVPLATLKARALCAIGADTDGLERIQIPVLYLRAGRDRLIRPSAAEVIRRLVPEFGVATIDGPHLLLQCRPEVSAERVHEFLTRLGPVGGTL